MESSASRSTTNDVSTSLPSTLPASAAFARPGPIAAATCATDTGASKGRTEPSGKRILIVTRAPHEKKCGLAALSFVTGLEQGRKGAGDNIQWPTAVPTSTTPSHGKSGT